MHRISRRPTPASIISLVALFVALGGTSYRRDRARAEEQRQLQVRGQRVAAEGRPVEESGEGTQGQSRPTRRRGAAGAAGAAGPAGAAGAAGPAGATGPAGAPNPNADTLNGFAASSLIRSANAGANTSAITVGGADVTILTTTITAPTAGFFVVDADGVFSASAAGVVTHCGVDLDNSGHSSTTFAESSASDRHRSRVRDLRNRYAVHGDRGAHTIRFKAHNDGSGTLSSNGGSMNVVFELFGSVGGVGTVLPSAPTRALTWLPARRTRRASAGVMLAEARVRQRHPAVVRGGGGISCIASATVSGDSHFPRRALRRAWGRVVGGCQSPRCQEQRWVGAETLWVVANGPGCVFDIGTWAVTRP